MTVAVAGLAAKEKSALAMVMVTVADVLSPNFPSLAYEAVRAWDPAARVLILKIAIPEPSNGEAPKLVSPSRNTTLPVGTPPAELTVAVSVMAEPGAAVAGATRVDRVARAVTWRGMLSLLGKNA